MVADYANISILDVLELDYDVFLLYLRDAVIYNNMQTEEGQEYLESCWLLEQTKPEREKLREKFMKK